METQELYDATANILDTAIAVNHKLQGKWSKDKKTTMFRHIKHFAYEHGTVRLNLGRQCGLSTAVKARASKDPENSVVFVALREQRERLYKNVEFDVFLEGELDNVKKRYKTIYIEEPFYYDNIHKIYDRLARTIPNQTFVLVGT